MLAALPSWLPLVLCATPQSTSQEHGDMASLLHSWQSAHGENWNLKVDPETNHLEMLFGGSLPMQTTPSTDEHFAVLAHEALAATQEMHGVDPDTLAFDRVQFLPLGQIGSNDKVAVRFRQHVAHIPVEKGSANVLFSASGHLLAIQSTGLPHLSGFSTVPLLQADEAKELAVTQFTADIGVEPNVLGTPRLAIDQVRTEEGTRIPHLVWIVEVKCAHNTLPPRGRSYFVDALDGGILSSETTTHHAPDVYGVVSAKVTPGLLPDTATNPPVSLVMADMFVRSSAGTVLTDENGYFIFSGVNTDLTCTFQFQGAWADTGKWSLSGGSCATADHYEMSVLVYHEQSNNILLNDPPAELVTAQANSFAAINKLHDFVKNTNPTDTTADMVVCSLVNQPNACLSVCLACPIGGGCDPFPPADGSAPKVFFSRAGENLEGTTCTNTAFSTVVSHEQGHVLNLAYDTCNGCDGMGEGNASVWSMYCWDTPIVGENQFATGMDVANGLNERQFCGDEPILQEPGDCNCYGQVHQDGEVWLGAAWKIRDSLNTSYGNTAGDLIANTLFLGWMNVYDQRRLKSIIETQWLTIDDNDGNLSNGTPHCSAIDAGFQAQGFPGFSCN